MSFAGGAQPSASQPDSWWIWPTVVSVLTTFVGLFLCGLPGLVSFILIPLSALAIVVTAAAVAVFLIRFLVRRQPRRGASVLLALILPLVLWQPIRWSAECAHLALTVATGAGQAGRTSGSRSGAFEVYDWSIGLAGGPNTFLIRDVTDEIALPLKEHKQPASADDGFGEDCAGRVRHLLGHYYVCTM